MANPLNKTEPELFVKNNLFRALEVAQRWTANWEMWVQERLLYLSKDRFCSFVPRLAPLPLRAGCGTPSGHCQ